MLDIHLIRFAGREEHAQAIGAFDNVLASRIVLPGHHMVFTGEHIRALERAKILFAYIKPAKPNDQGVTSV